MFASVLINSNARELNRVFDYVVPEEMSGVVSVGSRVFVPFGRGSGLTEGYVIGFKDVSEFECKAICRVEDSILSGESIELARLMADKYFCNVSDCIRLMLPPGASSRDLSKRVKEKLVRFVCLAKSRDELLFDIENTIKSEKQKNVLSFFFFYDDFPGSDLESVCDVSVAVVKSLEKNGFVKFVMRKVDRNPFVHKKIIRDKKLVLNDEQQSAFDQIAFMIENDEYAEFLLKGVTGSGKTEVYLQLIDRVIGSGKSALVLAPISNLGLIIIDEAHDNSYKSDMTPRYHAKDLAKYIAKQNNIPLILGSATPDVCDYYKALKHDMELVCLTKRANNATLPNIEVVDMRQELSFGNRSMFSLKLQEKIKENLEKRKQTILFINRRGYSTFIMCRDCGYVVKCPNCNIALTYHSYGNRLKCHYCGHEENLVRLCPECGSKRIKYFGSGTQKVEDEISKLFPKASTIRMDIDTVSKKNSHEDILNKFKNENIDILIGTQMIVKRTSFS